MLVGGRISDTRDSRTPILLTFLVVSFVGFLLLARAESVVSLGLACIFIGAGQGGTSGPMMALLADLTPTSGWVGPRGRTTSSATSAAASARWCRSR